MQPLSATTVRFGTVTIPSVLRASNTIGDWKQHVPVTFGAPFGAAIPGIPKDVAQGINVILTPRSRVPVVAVVETVNATGFSFALRNADPYQDASGITVDWLAVLGVGEPAPPPLDVRLSVLQPKAFSGFLDQALWPRIWFSTPFASAPVPVVLLTANNLNVPSGDNPAVVAHPGALALVGDLVGKGVADPPTGAAFGFGVGGVNVDSVGGNTGVYAAAFATSSNAPPASTSTLWVDSGTEKNADGFALVSDPLFGVPFPVSPGGQRGDWVSLDVYFDRPFSTPPLVFATARGHTPVVPIARNVTTHGVTIAVRNTDSVRGHAAFHWVAIGCAQGCG
jgi:hypothetical protein